MPLDPFRYSQPIVDVYAACVDELLINLARHFNVKGTGNSGSFSYQTRMLAKMGAINRESSAIIAKHVKENEPMILLAIEQAMLEAVAEEEPQLLQAAQLGLLHEANIPVQESVQVQLTAYSRQAREQLNLVNTVMLEGTWKAYQDGVYQAANILKQMDVAQTALNAETGKVITGVSTRQQAVRSAVKKMAEVGITGFIDNGGHKWSPEAYVQMDIKTTCSNAARQAVFDRNRDYGNDLVWVRINATARPKCYPWQGKVISTEGRSGSTTDLDGREILFHSIHDTSYGEPDGLWGINCHHGPPNVFIPGLSSLQGSVPAPDDNAAAYALTQQQRKLERDVRAAKREAAMLDAAGDKEGFEKAALQVRHRQQLLKDFAEENNLYLRGDRTQVVAYNKSVAGKAAAAVRNSQAVESVRAAIRSDETPKKLNIGNQNKHIPSSHGFIEGRSFIYGTAEDAQRLVDQYHGTGEIRFSSSGAWIQKEFVTATQNIGVYVNPETGVQQPTNRFSIHYGKKGTHIVPAGRKDDSP